MFPLELVLSRVLSALATNLCQIGVHGGALVAYFTASPGASLAGRGPADLQWGGFSEGISATSKFTRLQCSVGTLVVGKIRPQCIAPRRDLAALVALQIFADTSNVAIPMLVAAYAIVMAFANAKSERYLSGRFQSIGHCFRSADRRLRVVERTLVSSTYDFFVSSRSARFVSTFVAPYGMGGGDGRLFRAP